MYRRGCQWRGAADLVSLTGNLLGEGVRAFARAMQKCQNNFKRRRIEACKDRFKMLVEFVIDSRNRSEGGAVDLYKNLAPVLLIAPPVDKSTFFQSIDQARHRRGRKTGLLGEFARRQGAQLIEDSKRLEVCCRQVETLRDSAMQHNRRVAVTAACRSRRVNMGC